MYPLVPPTPPRSSVRFPPGGGGAPRRGAGLTGLEQRSGARRKDLGPGGWVSYNDKIVLLATLPPLEGARGRRVESLTPTEPLEREIADSSLRLLQLPTGSGTDFYLIRDRFLFNVLWVYCSCTVRLLLLYCLVSCTVDCQFQVCFVGRDGAGCDSRTERSARGDQLV
eukprot:scaffold8455_cov104-Isochrysis_galbana.AAC.3